MTLRVSNDSKIIGALAFLVTDSKKPCVTYDIYQCCPWHVASCGSDLRPVFAAQAPARNSICSVMNQITSNGSNDHH